jgi:large subunit ribosomal protein L35
VQTSSCYVRGLSGSAARQEETTTTTTTTPATPPPTSSTTSLDQLEAAAGIRMKDRLLDRNTTTAAWAERKLLRSGTPPVGSRRRRAAIRTSEDMPFDQLPYQCFQEARKVLQEDRQEKLYAIRKEMAKIQKLEETPAEQVQGGEARKNMRLTSLRKQLEEYKILADINDPIVKRKFEDGFGECGLFLFYGSLGISGALSRVPSACRRSAIKAIRCECTVCCKSTAS